MAAARIAAISNPRDPVRHLRNDEGGEIWSALVKHRGRKHLVEDEEHGANHEENRELEQDGDTTGYQSQLGLAHGPGS